MPSAGSWFAAVGCLVLSLGGTTTRAGPDLASASAGEAAPRFGVVSRQDKLYFYPCSDCHEFMDRNDRVRELEVEDGHPASLQHGNGEMWCLSCHRVTGYDKLSTVLDTTVSFDQGHLVCGSCHAQKHRDWEHGAHGKRVDNWSGEREILSCPQCHNPHHPAIAPRQPKPPPPVRAGLEPMRPVESAPEPPWFPHAEEPADE